MVCQRLTAALLLLAPAATWAQDAPADSAVAPAPDPVMPAPAPACCVVPARTPIEVEILETINSKANQTGQNFAFRLAAPISIDGRIVVPAGTTGVGEIVHAERARFGGRAGELILAARYLDFAGRRIPLRTLRFGAQQGRDSSGTVNALNVAAAATVPVLSLVGFFVAGGEVNVPPGTIATAQTSVELALAPIE